MITKTIAGIALALTLITPTIASDHSVNITPDAPTNMALWQATPDNTVALVDLEKTTLQICLDTAYGVNKDLGTPFLVTCTPVVDPKDFVQPKHPDSGTDGTSTGASID